MEAIKFQAEPARTGLNPYAKNIYNACFAATNCRLPRRTAKWANFSKSRKRHFFSLIFQQALTFQCS